MIQQRLMLMILVISNVVNLERYVHPQERAQEPCAVSLGASGFTNEWEWQKQWKNSDLFTYHCSIVTANLRNRMTRSASIHYDEGWL